LAADSSRAHQDKNSIKPWNYRLKSPVSVLPWITGEQFMMADIYVYDVNTIVSSFGSSQLDWDLLAEAPGMKEWNVLMSQSAIAQNVKADCQANMPGFIKKGKAQIKAANTE
jgi:glutathione S-transferase